MKKIFLTLMLCIGFYTAQAQYITEVLEYSPAPGQFINSSPWGIPTTSTQSLIGSVTGSMSLGAYGGYVSFRFENPVENHPENPFGVDFTIFGNPLETWSEPAVVFVMKDDNGNSLPDDVWYELAGSDYHFSSTIKNYQVTYYNPNSNVATNVLWTDNLGNLGYILANSYHTQPYYPLADSFPQIPSTQYMLSGTRLENLVDDENPAMVVLPRRSFGYVDNQLRGSAPYTVPDNPYTREKENSGGDAFDISWAVDGEGNHVDLDVIHFVKVQTAILADAGWLGEVSTEITGAVDVEPNASITGVTKMIVIRDLPKVITEPYPMEVFVFDQGQWQQNAEIQWEISLDGVSVDADNLLTFTEFGEVDLICSLVSDPEINTTVHTILADNSAIDEWASVISVFPNPNNGIFKISQPMKNTEISVFNLLGQCVLNIKQASENQSIDISEQPNGTYLLKMVSQGATPIFAKIIKQ